MIKKSEQQLEESYNSFIATINQVFTGERLEKLLHMYSMDELGPNLMLSPASSNVNFHNTYEGGYIDHVMNVVRNSFQVMTLYEKMGGTIDFTKEELAFAALHHDLGKLGIKGEMNYIPNPSEWHIKNQGKVYKRNPDLSWMDITARGFYLLSQYEIKYSEKEYFGIQLTDGLYDDDNKKYLVVYDNEKKVPTAMHRILHWADHMSSTIEKEQLNNVPF